MKHRFHTLIGAAAAVAIVFAASSAQAQTKEEAKCLQTIGKAIGKYQAGLSKDSTKCHKSRNGAKIGAGTDCNDPVEADLKSKRGSNRTKASDKINKSCDIGAPTAAVLAQFPNCPSTGTAATGPITTWAELNTCLLDLSEHYHTHLATGALGTPDLTNPLSKEAQKCHATFGKGLAKLMKTVGKGIGKCVKDGHKLGNGLPLGACEGADPKSKISGTVTKSKDGLDKSCTDALIDYETFGLLDMCGGTNAQLKSCYDDIVVPASRGLANAQVELPGNCAEGADVIINAAYGIKRTDTRLDTGWTGIATDVDVVDQYIGAVTLSSCDANCENCDVRIDTAAGNCRCDNDASVQCNTVAGPDAACGGGTCNCYFGPSLALSSGGTPVCVLNRFAADFTGGTSVVGSYDVATRTKAIVHSGISATQPCPTCDAGLCSDGPRAGLACSVDAVHPDFGDSSFDCPPDPGSNISGSGLSLALQFTDGTQSITAAIPSAGAFCDGAADCHCSHCSANAAVACTGDADCDDAAIFDGGLAGDYGTCGVDLTPNNPQQSDCDLGPGDCNANSDGLGLCDSGPFDSYCSGALKSNGAGIIPCSVDGDCTALNPICPGSDCGTCSTFNQRACFAGTISATGSPGIYDSQGISTFCSAQTSSTPVNQVGGLPGPGRVSLDFDFEIFCDAAHTTVMHMPGGSNCP